jgi:hypothetical protein
VSTPPATDQNGLDFAFRKDEAVALASAYVCQLARYRSIRALLIKGQTGERHGLRAPKDSADVDVLVDPIAFDALRTVLVEHGWIRRQDSFRGQRDAPHSVTLMHASWPCDIDLHRFFPGFLGEPQVTFDELWGRSEVAEIGHCPCFVTDKASTALILILNELRADDQARAVAPLDRWVAGQTTEEAIDFRELIAITGAELALESLKMLSPGTPAVAEVERSEASQRLIRGMSGVHGAVFLRMALSRANAIDRTRGLLRLTAVQLSSADHARTSLRRLIRRIRHLATR